MDSCPQISVIVPVYNVAPYLRRCLKSICNQGGFQIEIVCVDDGSTDGGGDVLDECACEFNGNGISIKVVHQSNQGVSVARNVGLSHATGEWVLFLDGDDELAPGLMESLFTRMVRGCDIDAFAYKMIRVDSEGEIVGRVPHGGKDVICQGDSILGSMQEPLADFKWLALDKMYRRSALCKYGLQFPVGMNVGEDVCFAQAFLAQCGNVLLCPSVVGYRYLIREGSAIARKYDYLVYDPIKLFSILNYFWRRDGKLGVKKRLQKLAASIPMCGKEEFYGHTVREKAIGYLLSSIEFKHQVLPFMLLHGTAKSRLFAAFYMMLPTLMKRKVLERI